MGLKLDSNYADLANTCARARGKVLYPNSGQGRLDADAWPLWLHRPHCRGVVQRFCGFLRAGLACRGLRRCHAQVRVPIADDRDDFDCHDLEPRRYVSKATMREPIAAPRLSSSRTIRRSFSATAQATSSTRGCLYCRAASKLGSFIAAARGCKFVSRRVKSAGCLAIKSSSSSHEFAAPLVTIDFVVPSILARRLRALRKRPPVSNDKISEYLAQFSQAAHQIIEQLRRIIVGQTEVIEQILAAIFTRGHCLLVGVPGLAKTLMVSSISQILDVRSSASSSRPT